MTSGTLTSIITTASTTTTTTTAATSSTTIKEGTLTRARREEYYVLTQSSLDCYNNKQCEKLKKRYLLPYITQVLGNGKNDFVIHSNVQDLELRADDSYSCKEWVDALTTAASKWRTKEDEDLLTADDEENYVEGLPSLSIGFQLSYVHDINLHEECAMMKYARNGKSIPHERVFKMDNEKIQVVWRKPGRRSLLNNFSTNNSLFIGDVMEVRLGQQTSGFNDFPYAEVEKQSFSLIFNKEQGEWCGISSLDLICDSVKAFENWRLGLEMLVYGHEGMKAFRECYDVMDPLCVYLKRYWSIHMEKEMMLIDVFLHFIWRLHRNVPKRQLKNFILELLQDHFSHEHISWNSFCYMFNLLNHRRELYEEYKKRCSNVHIGMTPAELAKFLITEQKLRGVDNSAACRLIKHHDLHNHMYKAAMANDNPTLYQQSLQCLSFHGFVSFLRSADNSLMVEDEEDMTQPMCNYFIDSSHNTYLTGHQLKGLSSCEAYVYALLKGSRCLEIDTWDGQDEPMVTHGMTLTTKVRLRDVLDIIKVYAFDASPYPVILSLENHCSPKQQMTMARYFNTIFGDMLATENLSGNNTLPSPEQLKYKVILKGKAQSKPKKQPKNTKNSKFYSHTKKRLNKVPVYSSISEDADLENHRRTSSFDDEEDEEEEDILAFKDTQEGTTEDQEVSLDPTMGSLIVYCKSVPYKPSKVSLDCCEMHSFHESVALQLLETRPEDIVLLSQRKFLRSYPKGSRVESSNYNPMLMWQMGVQMAAINLQKPDLATHVNTGFFKKSKRSGYVLKPKALIESGSTYHPKMVTSENTIDVNIEIICGQFVNPEVFATFSAIFVEIQSVGIDASCGVFTTETTSNMFNPVWRSKSHIFEIVMPELCVLYFKVFAVGRINKLIYQNCFPADKIRTGLRYIPLNTITGVKRHENGLFVNLAINRKSGRPRKAKPGQEKRTSISECLRSGAVKFHDTF